MFTDFRDRATYFGTLDDVVERYPWPNAIDFDSIQKQLITSAIYGKKILVNDGYLVANRNLVGDLKDIGRSLMGNLLTGDCAHLFARGSLVDLAAGIEQTAKSVSTHREIVGSRAWAHMRDDLEFLSNTVKYKTILWPGDKNMGEMFFLLMKRIAGLVGEQRQAIVPAELSGLFDKVFRRFQNMLDETFDGARTHWENSCWQECAGIGAPRHEELLQLRTRKRYPEYNNVRQLMNIANEAYHLAYAAGAGHSIGSGSGGQRPNMSTVGVATALVTAIPDLVASESGGATDVEPEILARLNQLILTVPPSMTFNGDFSFIGRLSSVGSCRRAKDHYLNALEDFVAGQGSDQLARREALAREARDTYACEIASVMAPSVKAGLGFSGVSWVMRVLIDGAIGLINLKSFGLTFGIQTALSIGSDYLGTKFVERLMARRVEVALGEEGIQATQLAGATPLAREYGLYMGPLNAEGMTSLIGQVSCHPALHKKNGRPSGE